MKKAPEIGAPDQVAPVALDQERLQLLLASSPAVIYACEATGAYAATFISANVTRQLGYPPEAFIEDPGFWAHHIHADDAPRVFEELAQVFEHGHHVHEYRFQRADGKYRWMRDELRLLRAEDGSPRELVGSWIDIHDRRLAEAAVAAKVATAAGQLEDRNSELHDRERFIERVVGLSPNLTYIYDLVERRNVYSNDGIERMLGLSAEDLLAMGPELFQRLMAPESWPAVIAHQARLLEAADGEVLEVEYAMRAATGEWRTLHSWESIFARDPDGSPRQTVGIALDVTEAREAQAALLAAQERLEVAVQGSADGLWDWSDIGADDQWWSPGFYELLGYQEREIEPRLSTFLELVHPEERARTREEITAHLDAQAPFDVEYRLRMRSGDYRWFGGRGRARRDEAGRPLRMAGSIQDIHDRKVATRELALRNRIGGILLSTTDDEMYAEVLTAVRDAVASDFGVFGYIDEVGALVVPTMTRHVWDRCDIPDKDIVFPRDTWGDSIWPRAIREQRTLYSNAPSERLPAGHLSIARNIAVPLLHQGEAIGLLQVANKPTDYTPEDLRLMGAIGDMIAPVLAARLQRDRQERERRRSEQEVRRLNRELEDRVRVRTAQLEASNGELESFAYSVSHDLRAPLRAVAGFSRALEEDCADQLDEQGRDYLQRICSEAGHMARLIDDLLKLSRITRGDLRRQELDLSQMAREITGRLRRAEPERQVIVTVRDGLLVAADPGFARQALENLLGNAWKFTGREELAEIEIGSREVDGKPVLFVQDNGVGFDPRYAGKLFAPFQRLHRMSDFPGTGIGLSLVQRTIARHGGRIWFESVVDQGATFFFTFGEAEQKGDEHDA